MCNLLQFFRKKISEINAFSTKLYFALVSRKWEKFTTLCELEVTQHTKEIMEIYAFLAKISWNQRIYLKNYKRVDLTEKNFGDSKFFIFPHCAVCTYIQCVKTRNLSPIKYFVKSTINIFTNTVTFTNFLLITAVSKLRKSHCGKIYSHQNFFPSNQLFSNLFSKCVGFTKFLPKKRESM